MGNLDQVQIYLLISNSVTDVIKKKVLRHHKKMLHYQNKRLQKCVSQILFVLLQCHSELCLFLQHDNKQNVWIWQASRCTNRVA